MIHLSAPEVQRLVIERIALGVLVALFVLALVPALTYALLRRTSALRNNYRGEPIPVMFGLSIVVSATLLYGLALNQIPRDHDSVLRWITLVASFGLLGFVDDVWGDKNIKGLRGHITTALKEFRITTGLMKAIGGVVSGVFLGVWLYPTNPARALASGLLIALGANALNLLDLRPGRAGGVFLLASSILLAGVLSAGTPRYGVLMLALVVLPALPAWILDSRAKVMLGDTGSNLLGASLGLAVAESNLLVLQIGTIVALIALHVVAERHSLTTLIAQSRILNALDRMTGTRR